MNQNEIINLIDSMYTSRTDWPDTRIGHIIVKLLILIDDLEDRIQALEELNEQMH